MINFLRQFAVILPIFLLLDGIWLGVISKGFYLNRMRSFARISDGSFAPVWGSVFLVYLLLSFGVLFLVLPQAEGSWLKALLFGGALGLVAYGVYDLTNHALVKDWSVTLTLVDIAWGVFVCGATSALTTAVLKSLNWV
ncbi:hypothetical protein AMJ57_02225 [Parcubacteria bacterium SG8_24]|nr:MAG: hypothetical protein AMJ57_02225 [Parcubacteria bacterium SG8_24]